MVRPQSAHARLRAGGSGVVASPRHHMDFKREQGPPPRRAAGAVAVSQPLWSSAFLEPSESSMHMSSVEPAASHVDDSRPATAVSYDFTANMKPVQLRRPLKCGDAVRLVKRPGGPKRPLHGWGPREVPPHPSSHGIVRKILRGNECLAHFQMENTTLRLQYSEIRMLWERWDGNTPIMKWTTVPTVDGTGAEVSLSRPMSAPSARSNAESTRAVPSQLRPASAHATTPTADTIYRERRPKPGANAVRNVSHLVHSSYNQQVLKAGESSLRYANAERIRRLAQPPGADARQKHELALLKLREKEERRALRRVENRLHKRPGRTVTRRAPRPPSAPNMPVSKYRRERDRAGRARSSAPIAGGDAAALSIQSAFRGHLARRELKAKKQQNTEEKEWDELEREAAERASAVAHAAGRSRVGLAATGKRPASASARVGGGQDRIKLAAQIFAGEDEGLSRRPTSAQPRRANAAGSSRTASEQTTTTGSNGAAMDIYRARPAQKKSSGTATIELTRAPGMGTKRQDEKTKAAREKRVAEKAAKEAEKERLAEEAARRAEARQRAWRKQEQLRFKSAEARMRSDHQQDTRPEGEERAETETQAAPIGAASRLQRKAQGEDAISADVALKNLAQPNRRDNQMITKRDGSTVAEQEHRFASDKQSSASTGKHNSKTELSGFGSTPTPEQSTGYQARQQILTTGTGPEPEPEREPELIRRTEPEVRSKVSATRPMAASKRQKPWEKKHKKAGNSTPPSLAIADDKEPVTETETNTDSSVGVPVRESTELEDKLSSASGANGLDTETEEERKKRLRDEDRAARKAKREARLKAQTSAPQPEPEPELESEVQEPEPEPERMTETEEERKKRMREADKAARKAKREAKLKEQQSAAASAPQLIRSPRDPEIVPAQTTNGAAIDDAGQEAEVDDSPVLKGTSTAEPEVRSKVSTTRPMAASKRQKPWEKKHKKAGNSTPPSLAIADDKEPVTETETNTDSSVGVPVRESTELEDKLSSASGANGLDTETEEERKKRLRDEDRAARKAKREARLKAQTSAPQPEPEPELESEVQEPEPELELESEPEPEPEPERLTETEEERKKRMREADKAARKAKREAKLKEQQSAAFSQPQPEPKAEVQEPEQVVETEEERKKRLREADKAARKARREARLQEQQSAAGTLETVGTDAAAAQGDFEDDLADVVAGMLLNSSSAAALSIDSESADDSIFAGLSDSDAAVVFSDDEL